MSTIQAMGFTWICIAYAPWRRWHGVEKALLVLGSILMIAGAK